MTKYKVLKPCVIESEYYEPGEKYTPSDHMSNEALKCLCEFDFLEEINDKKVKAEEETIDILLNIVGSLLDATSVTELGIDYRDSLKKYHKRMAEDLKKLVIVLGVE